MYRALSFIFGIVFILMGVLVLVGSLADGLSNGERIIMWALLTGFWVLFGLQSFKD